MHAWMHGCMHVCICSLTKLCSIVYISNIRATRESANFELYSFLTAY